MCHNLSQCRRTKVSLFNTMMSFDVSPLHNVFDRCVKIILQCCDICVCITMLLNRFVMINHNVVQQMCQDDSFTCYSQCCDRLCLITMLSTVRSLVIHNPEWQRHCSHRLICYRILLWWPSCLHLTGDACRKVTLKSFFGAQLRL